MPAIARRILSGLAVGVAAIALAPAASASITPALTLDQSAGTAAGSTANLGMDLKFAPSGSDSPKDLTLSLPAGLLANASIDGGACLSSNTPLAACQVGSGTATATPVVLGMPTVPVPISIAFDLVAPPKPGDLAGLALMATFLGKTSQLGAPGDITVRSSSDPAGVGLNIAFTGIPDTYSILGPVATPISVDELSTTFSGLRLPTSCPATPANVAVTADSYAAPTTEQTVTAPLIVTGCSTLPYTPAFHVTAAKDTADSGVQIATDITQPATPAQATSRTVALTLPAAVLSPNVPAVLNGGILCSNPSSGTCKTIGTASSTSPLLPTPLTGKDYLTGSLAAPAIAIVFPAPFALTLEGSVDLATNTTTFNNIPDIPLTDLNVTLTGGADAVFETPCTPPSGTATSTLTSQTGARAVVSSAFTVSNCTTPAGGGGGKGGGGTSPTSPKSPTLHSGKGKSHRSARPQIGSGSLSGLARGMPSLSFRLVAGKNAPKLRSFTIRLPRGLRFVEHRVRGRLKVTGVSVYGAEVKSIVLGRGRLAVTLRRPVTSLIVKLRARALKESAGLKKEARRHQIGSLNLTVLLKDSAGNRTTVTLQFKNP